ncbi:MAG: glycosyltransferase [Bacteroidota bacterium]
MKPRVLMLGWEHPPYFNGGLGVASTALAESIKPHVDLRMVVPKSGITAKVPAYELIGLNALQLPPRRITVKREVKEQLKKVKLHYVEVDLQGYENVPPQVRQVPMGSDFITITKVIEEDKEVEGPFLIDELYGHDLYDKVIEYTEIVAEMAKEWEFDIIHCHDWMTFLAGLELKAATAKPLVLHVHSLQYDRAGPESRDLIYQIERHAMGQADAILPVSHYTSDIIQTYYGISPEKITPIHNGLNMKEPYRSEKPFPENLVVFLGRITGQKGPAYFFEAAKKILEERKDMRFMLAGKGELIDKLIQQAAEEGLGDRIHFTGFLEPDRVRELLAMADVYVMPSVSEPFGLSALEAAHMGVPVILSENAGVKEVLNHALAIEYKDTDRLARMITSVVDDHLWKQRIVQGQKADLKSVAWSNSGKQVVEVYESLLS